jgi:DNA-binding LacI/PurR family transcriptional regulator
MPTSPAISKYKQIAESLREQIQSGQLQPEDRLPSFSEMRAQHGATPTTVERVYSLLERDGLVKREKGRGVFVARPQASRIHGVIGIVGLHSSYTAHPWGIHLLEGIQQVAREAEKELLLIYRISAEPNLKWEKIDAVLNLEPTTQIVTPHLPLGMPFVSALTRAKGYSSVLVDETGGVREAVQHLVNLGHQRIGYLIQDSMYHAPFLQPRITAYREALQSAGIQADARWVRNLEGRPPYREGGYNNMQRWLAHSWHELGCTALLVQNDDTAIGVMQALQEAGIRVPDDVSIVGFDSTEISEYCTPHLTSVKVPLQEVGAQSMRLLLQLMENQPHQPIAYELPTNLVVRASTAPPRRP